LPEQPLALALLTFALEVLDVLEDNRAKELLIDSLIGEAC
jgi:hypothetical protein